MPAYKHIHHHTTPNAPRPRAAWRRPRWPARRGAAVTGCQESRSQRAAPARSAARGPPPPRCCRPVPAAPTGAGPRWRAGRCPRPRTAACTKEGPGDEWAQRKWREVAGSKPVPRQPPVQQPGPGAQHRRRSVRMRLPRKLPGSYCLHDLVLHLLGPPQPLVHHAQLQAGGAVSAKGAGQHETAALHSINSSKAPRRHRPAAPSRGATRDTQQGLAGRKGSCTAALSGSSSLTSSTSRCGSSPPPCCASCDSSVWTAGEETTRTRAPAVGAARPDKRLDEKSAAVGLER